jgi:hypothetical protein
MSNRTWVCLTCRKSYRRVQSIESVTCPTCHAACEYVHWKIRIPSPKREKEWDRFWETYLREKARIVEFLRDTSIKSVTLDLLNQHLRRA